MALDDRAIRDRLNEELKGESWAHLATKSIIVENGVVHLFGFVDSDEERTALRLAAENVPGVKAVEDHLTGSALPRGL